MTKNILNFYASIEIVITQLVKLIVSVVTFSIGELAPLLAPLPPSFAIFLAMSQRLHMPFYVALISALVVELVGMYSSKISVRCYKWNSTKSKSEPAVPQGLSVFMTGIFFVVVVSMALTIELLPGLVSLIFPMFTLISIATYTNMAIDQNLRKLEIDKANDAEVRKEKNGLAADIRTGRGRFEALTADIQKLTADKNKLTADIARQQKQLAVSGGNKTNGQANSFGPHNMDKARSISNGTAKARVAERRQQVLDLKSQKMTNEAIANELGVSISTVKNDLKQLNGA